MVNYVAWKIRFLSFKFEIISIFILFVVDSSKDVIETYACVIVFIKTIQKI